MGQAPVISVDDIKAALLDRIEDVVGSYVRPGAGSYRLGADLWCLDPGRHDRSVGSFKIAMHGAFAGRWKDFASGEGGDLIDLIGRCLNLDKRAAFAEARRYLGLETESPEQRRHREEQAEKQRIARQAEAARARDEQVRKQKRAQALWLSAQAGLRGTPVDAYLRGRGIDLAALGYAPAAIRFHPECYFRHEAVDEDTGEVTDIRAKLPAMVTAISRGRDHIGTHRTYLEPDGAGGWRKARLPGGDAKKVLGSVMGGSIRLSNGIGPRGGRGAPLAAAPQGSRVYLAEGIETALSVAMALPRARVLAAVSLGNMAAVELPASVTELVIVADGDDNDDARKALDRAIAAQAARGRSVFLRKTPEAGHDFNDELVARLRQEGAA